MATTKNSINQKDNDSTSKKGFAAMDDKKQKEAASKGGKSHGAASKK